MTFREETIDLLRSAGLRIARRGGIDPMLPPFVEVAFGGYEYPDGRRHSLMSLNVNVFGAWALGEDADRDVITQVDIALGALEDVEFRGVATAVTAAEPAALNPDGTPNFAVATITVREL